MADCLRKKLGINFRGSRELTGWYWLDGKKILHVTVPKGHGSSEINPRYVNRIISSLRIQVEQFQLLYKCPMKGPDYEQVIRELRAEGKL